MKTAKLRNILLVLCIAAACFTALAIKTNVASARVAHPKVANYDFTSTIVNSIDIGENPYCLGIPGQSTQIGAQTIMWNCNGHPDQEWLFHVVGVDGGGNYYNIINTNSGLCLGIPASTSQLEAVPVQWTCNGNTDQQWYAPYNGGNPDNGYRLVDRNDGECVGVWEGNVFTGAAPVQWACNGNPDQTW